MSTIDNPGQSLFQGPDIKINNSQNNEEDEDLEDQLRRQEELQNLLHEALDDFKYDDSTINSSSNVSVASLEDVHKGYRDALPSDQLKVLYDVKIREITNLKNEFDSFKMEKKKEVDNLKNKLILNEADIMQLKQSVKNTEGLLVEKTETINSLKKSLDAKDKELATQKSVIEEYKIEVCTYKSTINELQLKISENNPFKMSAKCFESEELHKAHVNQILRLESEIEEQSKKAKIYEKENKTLKNDMNNLIQIKSDMENEYKTQINLLTVNITSAQEQCKDLVDLLEMLKKENDHFKERVHSYENNDPILTEESFKRKSLDYDSLLLHLEKVKRMLLDRSIEVNTMKTKLKFYESDVKELLEYRNIKADLCIKQYKKCGEGDHIQDLLVMQNELKNLRKVIDDKDSQISNISSINRELQDKIEEMLLQTRNEIQNLSHKYNVPQLEIMNDELNKAEHKVIELEYKLGKLKEENEKLNRMLNSQTDNDEDLFKEKMKALEIKKIELEGLLAKYKNDVKEKEKAYNELKAEKNSLKAELKLSQESIKDQLNQFIMHFKNSASGSEIDNPKVILILKTEIKDLILALKDTDVEKHIIEERLMSWKKQLDFVKFTKKTRHSNAFNTSDQENKELYGLTMEKLEEAQNKIANLQETMEELNSAKTIAEGEKYTLQFQLRDCESHIQELKEENNKLTAALSNMLHRSKGEDKSNMELNTDLKKKEELIDFYKKDKVQVKKLFEILNNELTKTKDDVQKLEKELAEEKEMHKIAIFEKNAEESTGIENVKLKLQEKEEQIQCIVKENEKIVEILESFKNELTEAKKEIIWLEKELSETKEKNIRRNLEKELKEAENQLEQSRIEDDTDVMETEQFKKCLQAELIKIELNLHEQYQVEFMKKLNEIEKKYLETINVYKQEVDKTKGQEQIIRAHMAKIMNDCGQKLIEMEVEKNNYLEELKNLQAEYTELKDKMAKNEVGCRFVIDEALEAARKSAEETERRANLFLKGLAKIQDTSTAARKKVIKQMKTGEKQIAKIERKTEERKAKVKMEMQNIK